MHSIHNVAVEAFERRLLMSTYTVNSLSDATNPVVGQLTLRQAVVDANNNPGADTISFDPTVFAAGSLHTITLTQGQIVFSDISGATTVQGPGATVLAISGNQQSRVFNVAPNIIAALSGLTVTNGTQTVAESGGDTYGGGIYNAGQLTLSQVTVSNNSVIASAQQTSDPTSPIGRGIGGGIFSADSLVINNSVISNNSVVNIGHSMDNTSPPFAGVAIGGGIWSGGSLALSGDTISGNKAAGVNAASFGFDSGPALGGGVYVGGPFTMVNTSVTGNIAQGGDTVDTYSAGGAGDARGGGLYLTEPTSTIQSSTITNNSALGGGGGLDSGSSGTVSGGGVFTMVAITIANSFISGNTAKVTGHNFAGTSAGGGLYAGSTAKILSSTISNNTLEGGVSQAATTSVTATGGGAYVAGVVDIEESTISGNSVSCEYPSFGPTGASAKGGGLFAGAGSILNSTISGNSIVAGAGYSSVAHDYEPRSGGYGTGGGVDIGAATITNSTIAGNSVTGGVGGDDVGSFTSAGNGGDAFGGGLFGTESLTISDTTISGNSTTGGAGGTVPVGSTYNAGTSGSAAGGGVTFVSFSNGFNLTNSIVAGDTANGNFNDIQNAVSNNGGHDFVGVGGFLTNGVNGNIVGKNNPDLLPLAYYAGGVTATLLPAPGSPVIDAGSKSLVPAGLTTDQRGSARIVGASVDIGSVEATATVSGTIFNDINGDGIRQAGEPALVGVGVYADLTNSGTFGGADPFSYTDAAGNYNIYGLPSGTVILRQFLPAGYRQSFPVQGAGEHVNVGAAAVTGAVFADTTRLFVPGVVTLNGVGLGGVLVYADLNNDGKFESGENNKLTTSNGSFAFSGLGAGSYTFRVVTPAGDVQIYPLNGGGIPLTLGSGGVAQTLAFSLTKAGTAAAVLEPDGTLLVSGTNNADSISVNASSSGNVNINVTVNSHQQSFPTAQVKAIVIQTFGGNDSVNITAGSGAAELPPVSVLAGDGNDTFASMTTGTSLAHQISITAGVGFDQVHNNDSNAQVIGTIGGQTFALNSSQELIGGTTYTDTNGDGKYETNEPVVPGFPVSYSGSAGLGLTESDTNGHYVFAIPASPGSASTTYIGSYVIMLTPGEFAGGVNVAVPNSRLFGTIIGTSGSYGNQGNTSAKAFDNNLTNYFDAPTASGSYIGLDFGSPHVVTSMKFAPRVGYANRMVGGTFQISNSSTFTGTVYTLYTVTSPPASGVFTTIQFHTLVGFQYVRYVGPDNSYCNIAEMQFFGAPVQLAGAVIGTSGSYHNLGTTKANAVDGNLSTFFDGPDSSNDWVGIDLGSAKVVTQVQFAPRANYASRMVGGRIQASNTANFSSGVVTLYTITTTPTTGKVTTQSLTNATAYRYYRYIGPANSFCDIAELQFFG